MDNISIDINYVRDYRRDGVHFPQQAELKYLKTISEEFKTLMLETDFMKAFNKDNIDNLIKALVEEGSIPSADNIINLYVDRRENSVRLNFIIEDKGHIYNVYLMDVYKFQYFDFDKIDITPIANEYINNIINSANDVITVKTTSYKLIGTDVIRNAMNRLMNVSNKFRQIDCSNLINYSLEESDVKGLSSLIDSLIEEGSIPNRESLETIIINNNKNLKLNFIIRKNDNEKCDISLVRFANSDNIDFEKYDFTGNSYIYKLTKTNVIDYKNK